MLWIPPEAESESGAMQSNQAAQPLDPALGGLRVYNYEKKSKVYKVAEQRYLVTTTVIEMQNWTE